MEREGARQSRQNDADIGLRAVLLVARSAFAAAPHREMREIAARASRLPGVGRAEFCFVEQGTPSLLEKLVELKCEGLAEITLVPLMLPIEPGFRNWLARSLQRWQGEIAGPWPRLSIAAGPAESPLLDLLLQSLLADGAPEPVAVHYLPSRHSAILSQILEYSIWIWYTYGVDKAEAPRSWNLPEPGPRGGSS
jgi:hypothetical protein